MAKDRNAQLRNLIAGYGDSIRLSDIKANIAVLFVAIMMGTAVGFRDFYPWYLSTPVILAPFIVIFICLLVSVYPSYPREGSKRFPIWRKARPEDFEFIADVQADLDALPERCALLSRDLWRKNITLQAAYVLSILAMVIAGVLLFYEHL
jgi:hypothetical protein